MKTFITRAFLLLILFWILTHLSSWFSFIDNIGAASCQEESVDAISDEDSLRIHTRNWRGKHQSYCTDFEVSRRDFRESTQHKNDFDLQHGNLYHQVWGDLYKALYSHNTQHLQSLKDSLLVIKAERALGRNEFADAVVKFIQDIPYAYIEQDSCLEGRSKPCVSNQSYGITTPVEFMYSLKGDCDSRTLILYTLLKDFGYRPLILISREYLHSMLALDIQSAGEYIFHNGQKFYFWETTAKGWESGIIPPGMGNKKYWNIALDYE